jgi:hypothetical protein
MGDPLKQDLGFLLLRCRTQAYLVLLPTPPPAAGRWTREGWGTTPLTLTFLRHPPAAETWALGLLLLDCPESPAAGVGGGGGEYPSPAAKAASELQVLSCVKPFSNTLSWAASASAAQDVVG